MKHWTIGKRLACGFGAVVAVVIGLGLYTVSELRLVKTTSDRIVIDSLPGTALSGQIVAGVKDDVSGVLEHLTATDAAAMTAVEANGAKNRERVTSLLSSYEATITQPDDRALFAKVGPARDAFVASMDEVLALSRQGDKPRASQVYRDRMQPHYAAFERAVGDIQQWNIEAAQEAGASIDRYVSSALWFVGMGVGLAVLVAAAIAYSLVRSTTRVLGVTVTSLRQGAEHVTAASSQVSMASQALSQGATEQAASLEETSASMEEMASMTRQNAEHSRQAAALMDSVDLKVQDSNASLTEMVASMSAIKESSDRISRIIKTIDEIAFQTNILALNAAVEAARAGEAGMGFAVVADEVRNLAQRSAQAARDTAGLIEESIARSSEGSARVQRMAGSIHAITDAVSEVKSLVQSVSSASQQQSQGIDQVSQAIAQMERVTQTNAATAEESAAASEELNAQAAASLEAVAGIQALVGGATRAGRPQSYCSEAPVPKVVPLRTRRQAPVRSTASAEEQIPLESSGTFGPF